MRSRYADEFNHDDAAPGYDADVQDESQPVRAGYSALLDWVVEQARVEPASVVVDLGSGTGNVGERLPPCQELTCVDVSTNMTAAAKRKLAGRDGVRFVSSCLLEFMHGCESASVDRVVSTYAVHHLPRAEKALLFEHVARALRPGGRAVLGDLMYEDPEAGAALNARYRTIGHADFVAEIEEEFPWDLSAAVLDFRGHGMQTETKRFSDYSWGLCAWR